MGTDCRRRYAGRSPSNRPRRPRGRAWAGEAVSDWLIEAARRGITPVAEPELPEGLRRGESGRIEFQCGSCGQWSEWPAEIEDFELGHPSNLCGGPPRRLPT